MAKMTARDYMGLYRKLQVPIVDENEKATDFAEVDIHSYLLSQRDNAKDKPEHYNIQNSGHGIGSMESNLHDHFVKKGATLKVFVDGQEKTFLSFNEAWYYARKAYFGKASPQEVQITLQLAVRFKLTTKQDLQTYCDARTDDLAQGRIGLDCNGFVGNFIEHGNGDKAWDADKIGESNYLANVGIKDIMDKMGPEVESAEGINFAETYVLGLIDPATNQVINQQAGKLTAHIVVTTPTTVSIKENEQTFVQFRAVESTHDVGLTESDYRLLSGKNKIFEVRRGSKIGTDKEKMKFKIRALR